MIFKLLQRLLGKKATSSQETRRDRVMKFLSVMLEVPLSDLRDEDIIFTLTSDPNELAANCCFTYCRPVILTSESTVKDLADQLV